MSQEGKKITHKQKQFFHLGFFLLCVFSTVCSTFGCPKCSGPYPLGIIARSGILKPGSLTLYRSWSLLGAEQAGLLKVMFRLFSC